MDEQQERPESALDEEPGTGDEAQGQDEAQEAASADAGVPAPDVEPGDDPGGDEVHGLGWPRPCLPRRARRRDVRRQWRKGVKGALVVLERSIPEDPRADAIEDLIPGFRRRVWDRAFAAWAEADLALSQTALGLLLSGARVVLVPDRGEFWAACSTRETGVLEDLTGAFRDPARCLAAARARLAADVVRDAPTLRNAAEQGYDCAQVRAMFLDLLEEAGVPVARDTARGQAWRDRAQELGAYLDYEPRARGDEETGDD